MIYNILLDADKHWGAMSPKKQYMSSYITKRALYDLPIDLYVNLGDLFDTKLLLNSKPAVYAIRDMQEKLAICDAKGIKVRAIRGTRSHDYDQWEIFRKFESENFRIFTENAIEETLPGLNCIYCPDENMNTSDYLHTYHENIFENPHDIAFFHGSFDVVLPRIVVQLSEDALSTNLVYYYETWSKIVNGPLLSGHWHDGNEIGSLIYVGSSDRWSFGEDEPKGLGLVQYDTETHKYRYHKIENILAENFKTYEVDTYIYNVDAYNALSKLIDSELELDEMLNVRVKITITDDKPENETLIDAFRYYYANEKRVKIVLVNQVQTEKKKKQQKEESELDEIYGYIRDPNVSYPEKIRRFVNFMSGKNYTLEDIDRFVSKYLPE